MHFPGSAAEIFCHPDVLCSLFFKEFLAVLGQPLAIFFGLKTHEILLDFLRVCKSLLVAAIYKHLVKLRNLVSGHSLVIDSDLVFLVGEIKA